MVSAQLRLRTTRYAPLCWVLAMVGAHASDSTDWCMVLPEWGRSAQGMLRAGMLRIWALSHWPGAPASYART